MKTQKQKIWQAWAALSSLVGLQLRGHIGRGRKGRQESVYKEPCSPGKKFGFYSVNIFSTSWEAFKISASGSQLQIDPKGCS